jgi:ABC-2 type transport system ATP-binding protein
MRVERGEVFGFLGPNGSGKTTSIRMMCGLLTPDGGSGHTLGYDILKESAAIKREVGYMTQRFGLYEDLTIRENLDFVARVYRMDKRPSRVDAAIERLGLTDRAKQLAGSLSGGWKQRLALAACMLHEPRLLLLDEPTAGVDPKARRDFWEEIHKLAAEGITVLVSTHYMDEAERCHRLGYIAYGKLLALGTPAQLIEKSGFETWQVAGAGVNAVFDELDGNALRQHAACERARWRGARSRDRALSLTARPAMGTRRAAARGCVHPPDGPVARQLRQGRKACMSVSPSRGSMP